MKRIVPLICFVALVAAGCGSAATTAADESSAPAGDASSAANDPPTADDTGAAWPLVFEGDTVGGGAFEAGDYEGQDLVLWFWAPW